MLLFFSIIAISFTVTPNIENWFSYFENYCKILVFYLILAGSIETFEDFKLIIFSYVAIMFIDMKQNPFMNISLMVEVCFVWGSSDLWGLINPGLIHTMANSIVFTLPFVFALYQDKALIANVKRRIFLLHLS